MERTRKRDWCGWLGQQGGQALTYVAILALVSGLIAIVFEDTVRELDGLSAAVVSAGSDLHLSMKECSARRRQQAEASSHHPPSSMRQESEGNARSVPSSDCPRGDTIGAGLDSGSGLRTDPWDVTVVLFGDADLDALKLPYPVPYQAHAEVLDTLLAYRPAAIFVDFMFLQERESEAAGASMLLDVLTRAREQNVPIVMALPDAALVNDKESLQRREKAWLVDKVFGCAEFAALTPIKLHDPLGLIRYPAQSNVGFRVEPSPLSLWQRLWGWLARLLSPAAGASQTLAVDVKEMAVASPAFAVADALARSRSAAQAVSAAAAGPAVGDASEHSAAVRCLDMMPSVADAANHRPRTRPEMEILWRTGANEQRTTVDGCGRDSMKTGTLAERLRRLLDHLLRPLTVLTDGYSPEFCPIQPVVSARALLAGDLDETGRRARFTGKVIAYGANFLGAHDAVKTPAGEHTPSVFIHAMAIHNLLLLEEDGYKVNELWRRWLLIAVVAIAAATLAVLERSYGRPTELWEAWAKPRVTKVLSAPTLKIWFSTITEKRRAEVLATVTLFIVFLLALYMIDRVVTVALVVTAVLLSRATWPMLIARLIFLIASTLFGFLYLRLGSLSILLVLGLLFVATKLDEGVGWFGARLAVARTRQRDLEQILSEPRVRGPSCKADPARQPYLMARTVSWLDQRRKASGGPPCADPSPESSTKEHYRCGKTPLDLSRVGATAWRRYCCAPSPPSRLPAWYRRRQRRKTPSAKR